MEYHKYEVMYDIIRWSLINLKSVKINLIFFDVATTWECNRVAKIQNYVWELDRVA